MNNFAEELQELIEKWQGLLGTTQEDILDDLMDAVEKLAPNDDD